MTTAEKFAATEFVIEATHNEHFMLWEQHHDEIRWEQDCTGHSETVGQFGGMPVVICCFWAVINGHRVLFWDQVSMVTHYDMAKKWLHEHCDPKWDEGRRSAYCDAANFHLCLEHCKSGRELLAAVEGKP